MGMDRLTLDPDLPRTLGHVLKYSLRATPCERTLAEDHYTVHDRLSLGRTSFQLFTKRIFPNRLGKRSLDDCELALAFELPDFVTWDIKFVTEIVPLQMMRAVMDEIISQLTPPGEASKRLKISHTPASSICSEADRHWIPALRKWLPGSWSEFPISEQAVKSDDATVNVSPWHSRIQLVLPWCRTRLIRLFEDLGLRRWKRNITRSFRDYLSTTYGDQWPARLAQIRQARLGKKRDLGMRSNIALKRRKTCGDSVNRGVGPSVTERAAGLDNNRNTERPPAFDTFDNDTGSELFADVTKGCAVLAQILASSWWEWSSGSALCFWRWNGLEQVRAARDGMEIFVAAPLPRARIQKQNAIAT
ncbi:hypothetical protein MHU86_9031 [Fragilaria crotonensis]|nr:hypothetical protein MHU86_9031 [Fragilaria crotonensis]